MRLKSLRILAFNLRVESGMPSSPDRDLSMDVILLLRLETVDRISNWLSLRVLKISLRRSATLFSDIGADARSPPSHDPNLRLLKVMGRLNCPLSI